jgi:5-methylcytosine-specific restriction enzyme A
MTTDAPMRSYRRHRTLATLPPRIAVAPQRVRSPKKTADPVYSSAEWRSLIARIITQRGRRCEKCGKYRGQDGRPIKVFGDHVVELRDGGALLDESNVQILCSDCHAAKTAAIRAARTAMRYRRG